MEGGESEPRVGRKRERGGGGQVTPAGVILSSVIVLSISIVCCDNAETIGRTLDSVKGLLGAGCGGRAEIVAVDSGSTDGTLALLEAAGARVVHQPWLGYVKQKQFALEQCAGEWLLHLDSDESLEPELRGAIEALLTGEEPAHQAYAINRKVFYAGRMLNCAWQPEWRVRLAKRERARWVGEDPHDRLELMDPSASVGKLAGDMRHDSIPTIAAFLERQAKHGRIAAASAYERGKRGSIARLMLSPVGAWCKQMILRRAFMDGWRGWVAAAATANAALCKQAALLEMSRKDQG